MTLERALEIAVEVHARHPFTDSRGRPISAGDTMTRLSDEARAEVRELVMSGLSVAQTAARVGISTRTVLRIRVADMTKEERDWAWAQQCRLNLESFRHMTEEWSA